MEAIDTKDIKNAVAKKYGYNTWDEILRHFRSEYLTFTDMRAMEKEVILEAAKQVAERQRILCGIKYAKCVFVEAYESSLQIAIEKTESPEIK